MALRPPGAGLSVARRLSERARAERAASSDMSANGAVDAGQTGVAGIEGMIDALRKLAERLVETGRAAADDGQPEGPPHGPPEHPGARGERRFSLGGKEARMVFGYTLKMGEHGVSAEQFGDMAAEPASRASQTGAAPDARQPIAEVFEDGDEIIVVAELPGADPAQIVCQVEGLAVRIEAGGTRRYRKTLALPAAVMAETMQTGFQNGILELRLRREGLS
jgi:HSP20 family protein